MSETAEKRLKAIKDFAELGSGFKIAMRDLEIRGAGNLLGSQQHGHIASVGFEMYCRLLEEAVEELRSGKKISEKIEPIIEIKVDAYIDGDYISDAMHKMEIYQKIAALRNDEQLENLQEELQDRFGSMTEPVHRLFKIAKIKNYARNLGIKSIVEKKGHVDITVFAQHNIKAEDMLELRKYMGSLIKFIQGQENIIRLKLTPKNLENPIEIIIRTIRRLAGIQREE